MQSFEKQWRIDLEIVVCVVMNLLQGKLAQQTKEQDRGLGKYEV